MKVFKLSQGESQGICLKMYLIQFPLAQKLLKGTFNLQKH